MLRTQLGTLFAHWNVMDVEWLRLITEPRVPLPRLQIDSITEQWVLNTASDDGPPVIQDMWDGTLQVSPHQLIEEAMEVSFAPFAGAATTARMLYTDMRDSPEQERVWLLFPEGLVYVVASGVTGLGQVTLVTRDSIFHNQFHGWASVRLTDRPYQGAVFTVVSTPSGQFDAQFLDFTGAPLVRDNYTDTALVQYDRAVRELNSSDPAGRVVILDGPTGTGKTHLVRALIHDVEDSMFLVLPQGMVEHLVGPSMIPMLIDLRDNADNEPSRIVFVLEDADDALVPRDGGNINLISALLNFGDGILGHALNIRVVATTNQPTDHIDPAIKRPGRMIAHLHLDALTLDHATRVLRRLNPQAQLPSKRSSHIGFTNGDAAPRYSLAEIYEASRVQVLP